MCERHIAYFYKSFPKKKQKKRLKSSNHTFFHVDLCLVYFALLYSLREPAYVPAITALIIQSHPVGDPLSDRVKISACVGAL